MNSGATPAGDNTQDGEPPTPATPMTPVTANAPGFNKPGQGQAASTGGGGAGTSGPNNTAGASNAASAGGAGGNTGAAGGATAPNGQGAGGQPPAPTTSVPAQPQSDAQNGSFGIDNSADMMNFNGMDFTNPLVSSDVLNDFDFDSFLHEDGDNQGFDFNAGTFGMEGTGEISAD